MSLFTLSIICIILWTVFIDYFYLHYGLCVSVSCMPVTFRLDARHCEFYIVGCWIFLYAFFLSYVWTQLIYPETVWSFQVLLLRVLAWYQKLSKYFGLGLIVLFTAVLSLSDVLLIRRFLDLALGMWTLYNPMWALRISLPAPFWWCKGHFLTYVVRTQWKTRGGRPCISPAFSLCSDFSLLLCPVYSNTWASWILHAVSSAYWEYESFLGFLLPTLCLENSFLAVG